MQFIVLRGDDPSAGATRLLAPEEVASHRRLTAFAGRATIYGFPLAMILWIWLAWPNVLPESAPGKGNPLIFTVQIVAILVLCPLAHEALHLLALPARLFLSDTQFVARLNGFRSTFFTRSGGRITREQFIWASLFPFIVLTAIPFSLLIAGNPFVFVVGFTAAYNFALSTTDIAQVLIMFFKMPAGAILKE